MLEFKTTQELKPNPKLLELEKNYTIMSLTKWKIINIRKKN